MREAREEKNLTQQQLGELIDKKRTYISRVENNVSNLTLKTLFDIVKKRTWRKSEDFNRRLRKVRFTTPYIAHSWEVA